jgi:hypothetical protein
MNGIGSCRAAVQHLLLLLLLLLLSGQLAAASQQSGYIPPPSTVPDFDPAVWNQAYQLTLRNVPAEVSSKELLQSLRFPNTMLKGVHLRECSPQGFETTQLADAALVSVLCIPTLSTANREGWRGCFEHVRRQPWRLLLLLLLWLLQGSCFSRQGAQGRRDYRVKLPGLALVAGNCWCYALGMFQGAQYLQLDSNSSTSAAWLTTFSSLKVVVCGTAGGYCYPGTNSEAAVRYRQKMTCTAVVDAVTADGGVQVSRQQALAGQPRRGHYVALLARPESCIKGHCYEADFHAMRKDSSGSFSWKHPGMPATNRCVLAAARTHAYRGRSSVQLQPVHLKLDLTLCASAATAAAAAAAAAAAKNTGTCLGRWSSTLRLLPCWAATKCAATSAWSHRRCAVHSSTVCSLMLCCTSLMTETACSAQCKGECQLQCSPLNLV